MDQVEYVEALLKRRLESSGPINELVALKRRIQLSRGDLILGFYSCIETLEDSEKSSATANIS